MLERIKRTQVQLEKRRRDLFDANWRFSLGDIRSATEPSFDDSGWRLLTLPHDWSIEGKFDKAAPSGGAGAYLPCGIGWYRKAFELSEEDIQGSIFLEFGGIMLNSAVYVNGNCAARRPYGYASFCCDITPYTHGGRNTVCVRIDASHQPGSRWYAGCGIYRHVYLVRTSRVYIPPSGVCVRTPNIRSDAADAEVLTEVKNGLGENRSLSVRCRILSPDGSVAAEGTQERRVGAGETVVFQQTLTIPSPNLWSLDNPAVYRVHAEIVIDGKTADDAGTYFGIRKFGYSSEDGFQINGEKVLIKGLCMHQNMGCMGVAVPERLEEETLLKLKQAGCNGIRLTHYPHSPETMALLDTIGFIAIAEAFDEWEICRPKTANPGTDGKDGERDFGYSEYFREWHMTDLTDFIRRDRNCPSVAFWSIGNEIVEQDYPQGAPMARKLIDVCHRLDPTRPVTAACMNVSGLGPETTTDAYMEALDIIGVNYVDHWGTNKETYYYALHEKFPDKILMGTEHVSPGGIRGFYDLHQHPNCWYTMYYNKMIDIEQRHKFLALHPYVLGDFIWTGIDYLGEAEWPFITPCTGILDTCGYEKDGYYALQSIWLKEKDVLHLVPHWNYPGCEGESVPVVCYTNCEYVELFVNGQSYGRQSWQFPRPGMVGNFFHFQTPPLEITTADLHLMWQVPYVPGTLEAVGYRNGKIVARREIHTAGAAADMTVCADADRICADGQDVVRINVSIVDQSGTLVPDAETAVTFRVEGAGTLWGVDNGSPFVGSGYRGAEKRAFNGLLCAVIRSNGEKGAITVYIESELGKKTIRILAE